MNKKLFAMLIVLMLTLTSVPAFAADHKGVPEDITFEQFINADDSEQDESFQGSPEQAQQPVIFEKTITVTRDGGKYKIGFVTLFFKKDFLAPERLPATFEVKVCVKDGSPGVEINPSTTGFQKDVIIKVNHYKGLLYDVDSGKNVKVKVKKQLIKAEHFSWFRFR
ncbi:MAG: hypothetical protein N2645_04230 [Clostridia bacterium]|nr:hypothetical protein [Clostridia bacterium]